MRGLRVLLAIILGVAAANADANASWGMEVGAPRKMPAPVSDVPFGKRVVAPFAAVVFCYKHPRSCDAAAPQNVAVSQGRVVLTAGIAGRIKAVNEIVNRALVPTRDGGADVWSVSLKAGDCEDFALTKRDLLLRTGFPSSAVLVAIARTPNGEGHAVLIVRTDGGALLLDNLVRTIRPWSAGEYRWDKIQSPEDPRMWLKL